MLYSSGTTGFPKGVKPALPHRRIDEAADPIVAIAEKRWGVTAADVYLSPAPIYHAEPLRWCGAVQVLGETVLLAGQFDAEATLKYVEQYHVRVTQMVPTMFVRLLKLDEATRTRYDLSSLRMVVHAAALCPVDIKIAMIDWLGPIVDDVAVVGVPHPELAEQVKALVQLAPGVAQSAALADELIDYTRSRIAHFKAPRSVDFVEDLPRTPTGKLVKGKLRGQCMSSG